MADGYANDILPKFRPGDVSCMKRKNIRLDDAQWMCDPAASHGFDDHGNARVVYSALSEGFMPPDGAWQQDWLDTYQKWMSEGFQP
jgi:hypothetical protein